MGEIKVFKPVINNFILLERNNSTQQGKDVKK